MDENTYVERCWCDQQIEDAFNLLVDKISLYLGTEYIQKIDELIDEKIKKLTDI